MDKNELIYAIVCSHCSKDQLKGHGYISAEYSYHHKYSSETLINDQFQTCVKKVYCSIKCKSDYEQKINDDLIHLINTEVEVEDFNGKYTVNISDVRELRKPEDANYIEILYISNWLKTLFYTDADKCIADFKALSDAYLSFCNKL